MSYLPGQTAASDRQWLVWVHGDEPLRQVALGSAGITGSWPAASRVPMQMMIEAGQMTFQLRVKKLKNSEQCRRPPLERSLAGHSQGRPGTASDRHAWSRVPWRAPAVRRYPAVGPRGGVAVRRARMARMCCWRAAALYWRPGSGARRRSRHVHDAARRWLLGQSRCRRGARSAGTLHGHRSPRPSARCTASASRRSPLRWFPAAWAARPVTARFMIRIQG